MKLDQPTEAIRFGVYTLAQITHIFYNSYPAQMLFDNSWKTSDAMYVNIISFEYSNYCWNNPGII